MAIIRSGYDSRTGRKAIILEDLTCVEYITLCDILINAGLDKATMELVRNS